jgi:uncharacterized protein (UPF0332 family)
VTPEAANDLESARRHLADAETILHIAHIANEAARVAYLAGFNAVQALVFARRGRAVKTHRGLRNVFASMAKDDPSIDPVFVTFLARAYRLKEKTDYGIGSEPDITEAEAEETIDFAGRLVDCIAQILA